MWEALPEVRRGQILPHLHISNHSKVPRAPRQYGILDVFVLWPLDDTLRKPEPQKVHPISILKVILHMRAPILFNDFCYFELVFGNFQRKAERTTFLKHTPVGT